MRRFSVHRQCQKCARTTRQGLNNLALSMAGKGAFTNILTFSWTTPAKFWPMLNTCSPGAGSFTSWGCTWVQATMGGPVQACTAATSEKEAQKEKLSSAQKQQSFMSWIFGTVHFSIRNIYLFIQFISHPQLHIA